jgi:ABC-type molybdate transport system substrate-binding protein
MRRVAVAIMMLAAGAASSSAQEPVRLHAAGSLRAALDEVVKAYGAETGGTVTAKYGPSGLLRDEIAQGGAAHVFASANMAHPQSLMKTGKSGPVTMFARNQLCALVRPGLAVTSATLLDKMLDPNLRLGTSTPKADPSGDYAFEAFVKADKVKAGARATLEKKALQLTGGPDSPKPPANRSLYGILVAEGKADIFLTYCTNAVLALKENPGQTSVAFPEELAVGADYGLTVVNGAPEGAQKFAAYILSPKGQAILAGFGFAPPR